MPPKLIEGSLYQYPGLPPQDEVMKIAPDLDDLLYQLASHVPEFGVWVDQYDDPDKEEISELIARPTKRAVRQILALFYADIDQKEPHSDRKIKNNLDFLRISVLSRIAQIDASQTWLNRRRRHDEAEAGRVLAERDAVLNGERTLYYPRLTQKPFISSTDEQFAGSSRNLAKTVQKIFADPTNCFEIKDEKQAAGEQSIRDLILDPRYITWKQLENLGLAPSGKFKPLERMERRAEAIPGIKKEFFNLTPVGGQDPHFKFGKYRVFQNPSGRVLGITNIKSGHSTVYGASLLNSGRRLRQIEHGYRPETRQLVRFLNILRHLDDKISRDWRLVKDPEELSQARTQLMEIVAEMENVRNEDKVVARDLLEEAMTLESTYIRTIPGKNGEPDRREVTIRLNPGAKRSQINKAVRSLKKRLNESIPHISLYTTSDKLIIDEQQAIHENIPFRKLLEYLQTHDKGRSLADQLKLSPRQRKAVEQRLIDQKENFLPQPGKNKFFEPWRTFCNTVVDSLNLAISTVRDDQSKVSDLKNVLEGLRNILVLHDLWEQWEGLYDKHLGNDRTPYFVDFARDLRRLRGKSAGLIALPDNLSQAFSAYDDKIEEMLPLCEAGVNAYKAENEKQMEDARLALKRQMKLVDIIDLLKRPQRTDSFAMLDSGEPVYQSLPPEADSYAAVEECIDSSPQPDSEIPPTELAEKPESVIPPTQPSRK